MKERKLAMFVIELIIILFLFSCLNISFISATANLSIKVTGTINNYSSDFYFKVDNNSNNAVDVYDMLSPSDPGGDVPVLYSSVSGNNVAIDSANATNRTINLTYTLPVAQTGTVNFSWQSLNNSGYNGSFVYYGDDNTYTTAAATYNMRDYDSYTGNVDGDTNIYVRIIINTQGESRAVAATTPVTSSSSGSGGGGGNTFPTPSSEINPIIKAVSSSVSSQIFAGESYVVGVNLRSTFSVRKKVFLSFDFNPGGMFFLEETEMFVDPEKEKPFLVKITPLPSVEAGNYTATVLFKYDDETEKVNVVVDIPPYETKLLDIKADPVSPQIKIGEGLELNLNFTNLGNTKVDARLEIELIDTETGKVVVRLEKNVVITEDLNTIEDIELPSDIKSGRYLIQGNAYYTSSEKNVKASFFSYVTIKGPSNGFLEKIKYFWSKIKEYSIIGFNKTKAFISNYYARFKTASIETKKKIYYAFFGITGLIILILLLVLIKMIIQRRVNNQTDSLKSSIKTFK